MISCALFFIATFCPDHILPFCYTVNLNFSWMKNILIYIHRYKWKIGSSKVSTLHLLVNCELNTCFNIWSQSWSVIWIVQMKQNKIRKKENFTFSFCNFHLEFSCEGLQFCITNVIKYTYLFNWYSVYNVIYKYIRFCSLFLETQEFLIQNSEYNCSYSAFIWQASWIFHIDKNMLG